MQKAVGYLLPSPTHPSQGHPRQPPLTQLGLRALTPPGQAPPSINNLLHCCLALAAPYPPEPTSRMGEPSIPSVTAADPLEMPSHSLEKYPLSFSSLEGSLWSLEIFLSSIGNDLFLSKSPLLRGHRGPQKQLLGSRRGKETPETYSSARSGPSYVSMGLTEREN